MEINPYQGDAGTASLCCRSQNLRGELRADVAGMPKAIGILSAVALPFPPAARPPPGPATHRMQCSNNLKQIAIVFAICRPVRGLSASLRLMPKENRSDEGRTLILAFWRGAFALQRSIFRNLG
jgi:hypothetical protein